MTRAIGLIAASKRGLSLDVGSRAIEADTSYRSLLVGAGYEYLGLDVESGSNVDRVMPSAYDLGVHGAQLAVSGQAFEHVEWPWELLRAMAAAVVPGGHVVVVAPSAGPVHRFPIDAWRFYPDAWKSLGRWANLDLVATWVDAEEPWRDSVGVFQRPA